MKIYSYYYKSESGDEHLEMSREDLDICEAMFYFGWESLEDWESCDSYKDIPYCTFLKSEINVPIEDSVDGDCVKSFNIINYLEEHME